MIVCRERGDLQNSAGKAGKRRIDISCKPPTCTAQGQNPAWGSSDNHVTVA